MILDNGLIIDDEDYNQLKELYTFYYNKVTKRIKIRLKNSKKHTKQHYISRFLLNAPKGMVVDHINGNTLDNRRCNLRLCTERENSRNVGSKSARGLPKGVSITWNSKINPFSARIVKDGKVYCLGLHKTIKEAAEAYNKKAKELHGEFARLNDIESIIEYPVEFFKKGEHK